MEINKIIDGIKVWDGWAVKYKEFVPQFIEEAINKSTWQEWDKKVFTEFFEKNRDQCVSSLQQGYYTNIEKSAIKKNWSELAPLLKKIASQQDELDLETYSEVKKWFRKHTSQNRKASVNRLIASLQPELLCSIVNESSLRILMQKINLLEPEANLKITGNWFLNSNTTLNYFKTKLPNENFYDIMTYPWQTYEILTEKKTITNTNEMSDSNELDTIKELLSYKKQIILQGPPGTGKTRLAKELAEIMTSSDFVTDSNIIHLLKGVKNVATASGNVEYEILEINVAKKEVYLKKSTGAVATTSFDKIRTSYNNRCWGKSIDGNDDRRACAIAKYIFNANQGAISTNEDNVLIIQFHPSYTYEDFVRGIVAKPNTDGDGVIYEAENKTLALFAKEAFENYKNSNIVTLVKTTDIVFDAFVAEILNSIDTEEKFMISEKVYIYFVDNNRFKYKGDNWTAHPNGLNMNFTELKKIINLGLSSRQEINKNKNLNSLTRQHATYYQNVVQLFKDFSSNFSQVASRKVIMKNYVLIIDEINRANLAAVLGELIYAFEYRGKAVKSMYDIDGDKDLILPPNLYVIGTMNTADRSVGHIDYAIRRRFAFVDVLPKDLSEELGNDFDEKLFEQVANIFVKNYDASLDYNIIEEIEKSEHLNSDFEAKDIWLGHSYFIRQFEKDQNGENIVGKSFDFKMRLDYEIKPILLEYIKDGILKESAKKEIAALKISI